MHVGVCVCVYMHASYERTCVRLCGDKRSEESWIRSSEGRWSRRKQRTVWDASVCDINRGLSLCVVFAHAHVWFSEYHWARTCSCECCLMPWPLPSVLSESRRVLDTSEHTHTHTHTASHSLESGSWNRIWCVYVYQFVCVYVSKLTAVQSLWMFQQAVSFYQSNSINVCKAELQLSDWMCVWRSLHAEFCVITRISVLFFLLLCLE